MIENKKQKRLALAICALLSYAPITFFVNTFFNIFVGEGFIYDTLFIYLVLLVIIIMAFSVALNKLKIDVLYFFMFLLIMYCISLFFNADYMFTNILDFFGNPLYVLFIFSFPCYMFIRQLDDYDILYKYLRIASIITVTVSLFSFIILHIFDEKPQYMVFSYNMLLHTVFLLVNYFAKKRKTDLFFGLLGFLLILFAGARGALLSVFFSLILYFSIYFKKIKNRILIIFIALLGLSFLILLYDDLLKILFNIAEGFNIDSRNLQFLLSNDKFFESSERFDIYIGLIQKINIFGYGLYGDRAIHSDNAYAHNIFIEILVQFGIVVGSIIIILLIYALIKGLGTQNSAIKLLVIVFLSSGFFKLLLSGSYLNQEPSFYVLLGLCVNAIMFNKDKKRLYKENKYLKRAKNTDAAKP